MTKQRKITYSLNVETGTVSFAVIGSGKLTCNVRALVGETIYDSLPKIGKEILLHGEKAKLGDMAAGSSGPVAYTAMKAGWKAHQDGHFNVGREGGPREGSVQTIAASRVWSCSVEVAMERLEKLGEAGLKKFRKTATYRLEHAREIASRLETEVAAEKAAA